jgi:hypothetical protein
VRRQLIVGAAAIAALIVSGAASAHPGHRQAIVAPKAGKPSKVDPAKRQWQPGDHHVHSWYSADWKPSADGKSPPEPIKGGDSNHPITTNAEMAAKYGLSWMVATDHGGPQHSKFNRDFAYPEVLQARKQTKGLLVFFGMELDTPAAEHSTVIVPHTAAERDALFGIESGYNRREPWPENPAWNTEARMIEALRHMQGLAAPPVVIANHPSRTATGMGAYGLLSPHELRNWNDAAPNVAVGMEGAPGHQANGLKADGSPDPKAGSRGAYQRFPTLGGFDQMTARLGGFWDSMLGEGRRFWVTATSDSHRHYTEGGNDFWPGEYSKTYVKAARTYDDVLDGLRNGRVFVTLGDLVDQVDVTAQDASKGSDGKARAEIGGTLTVKKGSDVTIVIRVRDPAGRNFAGRTPDVARIDLIRSEIGPRVADLDADANPRARVEQRFTAGQWARDGETISIAYTLKNVTEPTYVRLRGTNRAEELEPVVDPPGEDPWSDLWFYANPVFIAVE